MYVRIKTWKRMTKEFELNPIGDIHCSGLQFTRAIEAKLPKNRIIKLCGEKCFLNWWINSESFYRISPGMIEHGIISYTIYGDSYEN